MKKIIACVLFCVSLLMTISSAFALNAGVYRVGSAGTYSVRSTQGSGTVSVSDGTNTLYTISLNNGESVTLTFTGKEQITVTSGIVIEAVSVSNAQAPAVQKKWYPAGGYRVGKDIPEGEYMICPEPHKDFVSYYIYYDTSSTNFKNARDFGSSTGAGTKLYFTVEDGEYLVVRYGRIYQSSDD